MEPNQNEINNTGVITMSSTVPSAISMQVNAHSVGIMYEQTVLNQQKDFQISTGNAVAGLKKLAEKRLRYKETVAFRKSRFDIL
ncbi:MULTISPECIES: hypothetical protein [unclassified Chryseobacterium]|uniref:hypothetical protein n=1 Tax=unclassified Chryseobacterium TaxID=2593645 RepID=UPI00100A56D8|nr:MULTISPECIES: hypothetical protein [unclassified Chryseobacterium]RXM51670.1 hypothetical protein BOQ64_12170 [Chryseobacterium sp. CH25]RXM67247.1 hypothetical protein BOQ60_04895 [Chryseobacterium sp. CH1]